MDYEAIFFVLSRKRRHDFFSESAHLQRAHLHARQQNIFHATVLELFQAINNFFRCAD